VLRGLSLKIQASGNDRGGRKWYYDPIDTMAAEKWPYVPPTTLYDTLKKLRKAGLVITGRNNKKSYDRTTWYSMPQEAINAAAEDLVLFDVAIAKEFGIEAALIFYNLQYHIGERLKIDPDAAPYHDLSPVKLAKWLPMSRSTVKRKIKELEKAGKIKRSAPQSKFWTITNPATPEGPDPNNAGPDPNEGGSNPNVRGPISNVRGSRPNNNTL